MRVLGAARWVGSKGQPGASGGGAAFGRLTLGITEARPAAGSRVPGAPGLQQWLGGQLLVRACGEGPKAAESGMRRTHLPLTVCPWPGRCPAGICRGPVTTASALGEALFPARVRVSLFLTPQGLSWLFGWLHRSENGRTASSFLPPLRSPGNFGASPAEAGRSGPAAITAFRPRSLQERRRGGVAVSYLEGRERQCWSHDPAGVRAPGSSAQGFCSSSKREKPGPKSSPPYAQPALPGHSTTPPPPPPLPRTHAARQRLLQVVGPIADVVDGMNRTSHPPLAPLPHPHVAPQLSRS